jgi:hypothetical protein
VVRQVRQVRGDEADGRAAARPLDEAVGRDGGHRVLHVRAGAAGAELREVHRGQAVVRAAGGNGRHRLVDAVRVAQVAGLVPRSGTIVGATTVKWPPLTCAQTVRIGSSAGAVVAFMGATGRRRTGRGAHRRRAWLPRS